MHDYRATIATQAPVVYDYDGVELFAVAGDAIRRPFTLTDSMGVGHDVRGVHRILWIRAATFEDARLKAEYQAARYMSGMYSTVHLGYHGPDNERLNHDGEIVDTPSF